MIDINNYIKNPTNIINTSVIQADQMIAYHDEVQFEVEASHAGAFAFALEELAIKTGKRLNVKTPIEAEAAIGMTWADTH